MIRIRFTHFVFWYIFESNRGNLEATLWDGLYPHLLHRLLHRWNHYSAVDGKHCLPTRQRAIAATSSLFHYLFDSGLLHPTTFFTPPSPSLPESEFRMSEFRVSEFRGFRSEFRLRVSEFRKSEFRMSEFRVSEFRMSEFRLSEFRVVIIRIID